MSENRLLWLVLTLSALPLLFTISQLSIGYNESQIYFENSTVLGKLIGASCSIFGENDYALRLPLLIIHFASVFLLYKVSKPLLKRKIDRVLAVVLFVLLPGVNANAVIVNNSSLVILLTLLFIFLYQSHKYMYSYVVLILSLFVDNSFAILYLALFFYAVFHKEPKLLTLSLVLFGISMSLYGFDTGGRPRGHFLDTMGVYAVVFSPFVFVYYVYVMYRILLKEKKGLLWYIVFVAFAFSFLLSFRQQLKLEDFLPFVVLGTPLMVRSFFESYRVRLPQFRRVHALAFVVLFSTLFLTYLAVVFNKTLYVFTQNSKNHFVYNYHVAKELANWLKQNGYALVHVDNPNLAQRLAFYGIVEGGEYELVNVKGESVQKGDFVLKYHDKSVAHYRIYKLYDLN